MPALRVALAQVNPTVGDISGNVHLVREWSARAAEARAHLVAFPEMMLTGYPVEDLTFRDSFVRASRSALAQLAAQLADDGHGELGVVVGYLDADGPARLGADTVARHGPRDSLALLHRGGVAVTYDKYHLPNYGVFDESRYFVAGDTLTVVRAAYADGSAVDVAFTICEDIWQPGGPFAAAGEAGVALVVNINASPYERSKADVRLPLVTRRAEEAGAAVAYVNMVGGQDELVFDGDSMIVAADGTLLARAGQFAEQLLVHDVDLPAADPDRRTPAAALGLALRRVHLSTGWSAPGVRVDGGVAEHLSDTAEVWSALVLGLRDYAEKNRFRSVVLGLSGGIDSAVVAAIAVDALGPEHVVGVGMPSAYSSDHSQDDAAELAKRTGLDYRVVPVGPMVDAFASNLNLAGVALENLQARCRGVVLMALSNQEGHLVLTTGNKSELAVGYSTLYGDSVGGFNPLKDVPKTLVWQLARWRNAAAAAAGRLPPVPENSIAKPPSAELRPGQLDSDTLPDYQVLDAILAGYVERDLGRDELVAAGHDPATVDRVLGLTDAAEYKRRQSAPGTKISYKAFGRDRRLPITSRRREGS
ncbi:NAD+ synthase [Hamadaea tsunoensis]|uniref:NAD+ synthase n=1 Tax=Hamadaea tsunoensis TaxID=53368 RepID=UPI0004031A30|nr:NAD+ synthase [Hamadaea tsunoensis]